MAEIVAKPCTTSMIPMAEVADVQRSIQFYKLLGLEVRGSVRNPDGTTQWATVFCDRAWLMLTRREHAGEAAHHGVSFYFYSPDLVALRQHLLARGVAVSEITRPSFMEKGEMQVTDPDGYTVFVAQSD